MTTHPLSKGIKTDYEGIADSEKKICVFFTPRAGCTTTCKETFRLLGLEDTALAYSKWIHDYRTHLYVHQVPHVPLKVLKEQDYTFIKPIVNPYARAVSIWHHNFPRPNNTFREWMQQLATKGMNGLNPNEVYHSKPQYFEAEDQLDMKYLRLEKKEKLDFIVNGVEYTFDPCSRNSGHHAKKADSTDFVGDVLRSEIQDRLPSSYRYFYDEEIRTLVEKVYRADVEKYGYTFEEL